MILLYVILYVNSQTDISDKNQFKTGRFLTFYKNNSLLIAFSSFKKNFFTSRQRAEKNNRGIGSSSASTK